MKNKILVIDDEKDFTSILRVFLESRGYRVIEANNAVESGLYLDMENPDLIIIDLRMPGIDGFDACRAIRKNPKTMNLPIFIVSGLTSEEDIKKGLKAGANKYFIKEIDKLFI
jgi:DNA-binding response OmpR family regulator